MIAQRRQIDKASVGIDQGMLQVVDQLRKGAVTSVRAFLCTFQNDLLQAVGKLRHKLRRRKHLILQMFDGDCHCGIPVKGNLTCHHLIHGDAQGIDVTLVITVAAAHLLR